MDFKYNHKSKWLITFTVIFVFMELSLHLLSLNFQSDSLDGIHGSGNKTIRVLVLGESTSDRNYLTEASKAWPEYLQEESSEQGLNIEVLNFAKAAVTTNYFLKEIDNLLDQYRPDIVITMLGINDSDKWTLAVNNSFLSKIKVFKLISWIYFYFKKIFALKIHPSIQSEIPIDKDSYPNPIKKAQVYAYKAERIIPNIPPLSKSEPNEEQIKTAVDYLLKSLKEGIYVHNVVGNTCWLLIKLNKDLDCKNILKKYVDDGGSYDHFELLMAQKVFKTDKSDIEYLNKNTKGLAFTINRNGDLGNYKIIDKKIIDSGAIHLAMQYPLTKKIDKGAFIKLKEGTYYLENYVMFKNALKKNKWEKYFIDQFAGNFGHTTKLGHQLIAKNVLNHLPLIISKLKK